MGNIFLVIMNDILGGWIIVVFLIDFEWTRGVVHIILYEPHSMLHSKPVQWYILEVVVWIRRNYVGQNTRMLKVSIGR